MRRKMSFHAVLLVLFVAAFAINCANAGIGVNWGSQASHELPPTTVVQMLKDNGIQKVKLFESDDSKIKALAGSGIEVMVAIPNYALTDMTDYNKAKEYVRKNISTHNVNSPSGVKIRYVAIGNEPFLVAYKGAFINQTFPALENVQNALNEAGIGNIVKATVPLNADVYIAPSYNPVPSAGMFRTDIRSQMLQIIEFLSKNNAPFTVNVYPFLSYYLANGQFPMDYAFFDGFAYPLVDGGNGYSYYNVFDANYDTLVSALKSEGYGNMSIMIGEIGWPTDGDQNANLHLASKFYRGLISKIAAKKGSPLRPNTEFEVYLFSLFDEDGKSIDPGNFERRWGIFSYDGQPKFQVSFQSNNGSSGPVGAKNVTYLPKKWCMLKPDATTNVSKIEEQTKFACSAADCTSLGNGSSCNGLDANAKASYAFNQYFQVNNQVNGSCDFQGLAMITTKDISQSNCTFIIQLDTSLKNTTQTNSSAPSPSPNSSPSSSPSGKRNGGGAPASSVSSSTSVSMAGLVLLILAQLQYFLKH